MKAINNPTTEARRRYFVEFGASIACYVVVIILSRLWASHVDGVLRAAVALLPVLALVLVIAAVVRLLNRMDEMQRKVTERSLALAGVATAALAVTYGLLEGIPLPHPSAWWTFVVFMAGWLVSDVFVRRHYR